VFRSLHELLEVSPRGHEDQMNVVFHQHIAVHLDTEKFSGLLDSPQESLPVAVVPEYRPPRS